MKAKMLHKDKRASEVAWEGMEDEKDQQSIFLLNFSSVIKGSKLEMKLSSSQFDEPNILHAVLFD